MSEDRLVWIGIPALVIALIAAGATLWVAIT